jgi:hypothetical protein
MWKLFWKRRDTYQVEFAPEGRRPTTYDTGHPKTTSFLSKCSCARRISSISAFVHPASGYLFPPLDLPEAVLIGIFSRPTPRTLWDKDVIQAFHKEPSARLSAPDKAEPRQRPRDRNRSICAVRATHRLPFVAFQSIPLGSLLPVLPLYI